MDRFSAQAVEAAAAAQQQAQGTPSTGFYGARSSIEQSSDAFVEALTHRLLNDARKSIGGGIAAQGSAVLAPRDGSQTSDTRIAYYTILEELFDRSIEQLKVLLGDVNQETQQLVREVEHATHDHRDVLQNLNEELESISDKFKYLEDCINKVGNTTVQIGNTLETVDRQKKRAIEAKRLMQYFKEFNSYKPEYFLSEVLPKRKFKHRLFRSRRHRQKAAKITQQLNVIAKDLVKVKECENGITNIKRFSDSLLHSLLDAFNRAVAQITASRDGSIDKMFDVVQILSDFNGIERCIQLFIDRRFEFFVNADVDVEVLQEESQLDEQVAAIEQQVEEDAAAADAEEGDSDGDESDGDGMDEGEDDEEEEEQDDDEKDDDSDEDRDKTKSEEHEDDDEEEDEDDDDRSSKSAKQRSRSRQRRYDDDDEEEEEHEDDEEEPEDEREREDEDGEDLGVEEIALDDLLGEDGEDLGDTSKNSAPAEPEQLTPELIAKKKEAIAEKRRKATKEARQKMVRQVSTIEELTLLLNNIEHSCIFEYQIIEEVFALQRTDVIHQWISKMILELVKGAVENILSQGQFNLNMPDPTALNNYLSCLHQVYSKCIDFVNKIAASPDLPFASDSKAPLMSQMEQIFEDRRLQYIAIETKYLTLLYGARLREVEQMEEMELAAARQQQNDAQKKGFLSKLSASSSSSSKDSNIDVLTPRLLRLDVIISMIYENLESVVRCKKLASQTELYSNLASIFEILVNHVHYYMYKGMDIAIQALEGQSTKVPPKAFLFQMVQIANSVLQNVQRHLETAILPVVSSSMPVRIKCMQLKDDLFSKLEVRVEKGLDLMLRSILAHSEYILETEQKKLDFKNKEYNMFAENSSTKACIDICWFLEGQIRSIMTCLYGKNQENFLKELGLQFFKILTDQLKQYTVSEFGGIRLMRDLSEYQKCMRKLNIADVDEKFAQLREIANIFLVAPQNLDNVLDELFQKYSKEEVMQYVRMRSDYKSIFKDKEAAEKGKDR